jgi:hypothetical protein
MRLIYIGEKNKDISNSEKECVSVINEMLERIGNPEYIEPFWEYVRYNQSLALRCDEVVGNKAKFNIRLSMVSISKVNDVLKKLGEIRQYIIDKLSLININRKTGDDCAYIKISFTVRLHGIYMLKRWY